MIKSQIKKDDAIGYLDNYRKKKIFVQSLENLINNFFEKENNEEFQDDFRKWVNATKEIDYTFVPYSEITRIMFNSSTDGCDMLIEKINSYIEKDINDVCNDENIFTYHEVLIKSVEHINLAAKQKDTLYREQNDKINSQESKLSNLKSLINELEDNSKKLEDNSKELEDKLKNNSSKIYSDFIGILGIFASIIVTMFGGLSAISNSIQAITSNRVRIFSILMMSTLFSIVLIIIVFMLLFSISKLTNNSIKSCVDKRDENGNYICNHNFWVSYPIFFWGVTFFSILFSIFWVISSLIHHY